MSYNCAPTNPVPVLVAHGEQDEYTRMNGGIGKIASAGHRVPVSHVLDFWTSHNQCSPSTTTITKMGITCRTHSNCRGKSEVTFCPVPDMGHWWPGYESDRRFMKRLLGKTRPDVNFSNETMMFFDKYKS